jgi:polyisoprenoid-binding protein YceI
MKKLLLPILLIIITTTAFTFVNKTVTRSAITFKTRNMGIGVNGSISGLQADAHFNPADPALGTIEAYVDANSINTDNSGRDEHLKREDYFDAAHYPKITLKSVSLKHKSGDNYTGQFNLTIKGKTKLVDIPFTFTQTGNTSAFKGSFKLNRLDYGVGSSSMILSNEVTVNIDAEVRD